MRAAKKVTWIGGILALAIGLWAYFGPESNLHWIQRVSRVQFPRGIEDVGTFSDMEYYITAHVSLPKDSVDSFVKRYGFKKRRDAEQELLGVHGLEPRFNQIPKEADLVAYAARTKEHKWIYLLDRKTGSLWVTVYFPDMSGDPP